MNEREAYNRAAEFCAALARIMESGAGEPGPGYRLRQCESEFRAWVRQTEAESPETATLRAERDALQTKLNAQTKAAEEALARVEHIEWIQRGAAMKGEAP